jgi:hypothetical protein
LRLKFGGSGDRETCIKIIHPICDLEVLGSIGANSLFQFPEKSTVALKTFLGVRLELES